MKTRERTFSYSHRPPYQYSYMLQHPMLRICHLLEKTCPLFWLWHSAMLKCSITPILQVFNKRLPKRFSNPGRHAPSLRGVCQMWLLIILNIADVNFRQIIVLAFLSQRENWITIWKKDNQYHAYDGWKNCYHTNVNEKIKTKRI